MKNRKKFIEFFQCYSTVSRLGDIYSTALTAHPASRVLRVPVEHIMPDLPTIRSSCKYSAKPATSLVVSFAPAAMAWAAIRRSKPRSIRVFRGELAKNIGGILNGEAPEFMSMRGRKCLCILRAL
jgi:hypothetical protein